MNLLKNAKNVTGGIENALVDFLDVKVMLQHFKTYNFVRHNNNKILELDFNGQSLSQILLNEWLLTNTVYCEQPAFKFKSLSDIYYFKTSFRTVENLVSSVPFTFVDSFIKEKNRNTEIEKDNNTKTIKKILELNEKTILRSQTFCSPQSAVEFFHKQQRERKIWWRKFSALPGRFHTTETCHVKNSSSQFVEVKAEFPWGLETVEVIKLSPEALLFDKPFFEVKRDQKQFLPQVVTCETYLERIAFTYLCDAFEKFGNSSKYNIMRFSRQLAPYKATFIVTGKSEDTIQNLKELVLLLAKKIRKCGISTLVLPDMCSATVESQIERNDSLGIPYTILLNETTLKDGIISIRNRDTTLTEQSHVSLAVSHIEKLLKSS